MPGERIGLGVLLRVSMGISLYFGRGRASIMSINFCVVGAGGGKGGGGVKLIGGGWVGLGLGLRIASPNFGCGGAGGCWRGRVQIDGFTTTCP